MTYDDYKFIKVTRNGRVTTLTLANPPMNTVNHQLHNELSRIFYDVQVDPEADVIVLTGAGEKFSVGGDIPMMQLRIDEPERFNQKNTEMKRIIFGLLDLEKPIICRVNGDCIGLGATIALLCDIIIAADCARLGDPHVKMGYVAGDGGAIIWPQLIGFARAKEFLLTGKLLTAARAEAIGLINASVPTAELDSAVDELTNELANGARLAIKWTKTCVNIPLRQIAHAQLDASLAYEALTNLSADHQEAVTAFQEKRPAVFSD
jgi:enoyl-CoA hydratase